MSLLTRDELGTLVKEEQRLCASIFVPLPNAGSDPRQRSVWVKNLLGEAEKRLFAYGLRRSEVKEFLEPRLKLLENTPFWQHQGDGLAVFLSQEEFRYYRLPLEFEPLVVIDNRFYIKPLLPLYTGEGQFYVLALNQNRVRLFQCTRYSLSEVEFEEFPDNPQAHLLQFFHQVNKAVHTLLRNERAPLVLAGVESLFPMYQEANTYPHLEETSIPGNPEERRAEELRDQAWSIVQPLFLKTQQEKKVQYRRFATSESKKVSDNLREIVPAAYHGRVDTLFVAISFQQWGTFDPETNVVDVHQDMEYTDEDLLNSAATQTFLHGGTVYAVELEKMPENTVLAAVFRS